MKIVVFFLLLALTACQHTRATEGPLDTLSPGELNQRADKYDGVRVSVRGFLFEESENHAVWDSVEASQQSDASHCISVLYPDVLSKKLKRANRKTVLLSGVFRHDITSANEVFLGLCNKSAIVLDVGSNVLPIPEAAH